MPSYLSIMFSTFCKPIPELLFWRLELKKVPSRLNIFPLKEFEISIYKNCLRWWMFISTTFFIELFWILWHASWALPSKLPKRIDSSISSKGLVFSKHGWDFNFYSISFHCGFILLQDTINNIIFVRTIFVFTIGLSINLDIYSLAASVLLLLHRK